MGRDALVKEQTALKTGNTVLHKEQAGIQAVPASVTVSEDGSIRIAATEKAAQAAIAESCDQAIIAIGAVQSTLNAAIKAADGASRRRPPGSGQRSPSPARSAAMTTPPGAPYGRTSGTPSYVTSIVGSQPRDASRSLRAWTFFRPM